MATTWYSGRNRSVVMRDGADATLSLTWRGSWDSTPAAAVDTLGYALIPYKAGSTAVSQISLASGTSPTNFRLGMRRWVSEPLAAGTGSGTFNMCLAVSENSADANYYTKVYIYVTEGDTDVVRCVLLDYEGDTGTDTEWATTGTFYDIDTPPSLNANSWQDGDRLVIEFGGIARNTLGAARTANVWVGQRSTDGVVGGTNVTAACGRFEFSADIVVPLSIALVDGDLLIGNGDIIAYDGTTGALKGAFYVPGVSIGTSIGASTRDSYIYATNENLSQIFKLDYGLNLIATYAASNGSFPSTLPHFVTCARDGTFWVGHTGDTANGPCINDSGLSPASAGVGAITHHDTDGSIIGGVDPTKEAAGTPSGDLSADQNVIAYGSLGRTIFRVHVDGTQLADLATLSGSTPTNTVRGMKWLPDGGLLVADAADIKRLDLTGAVVQVYTDAGQSDWGTVALGPTGADYFWCANTGANAGGGAPMIAKFSFDGTVLQRINTPTSSDLTGAANSQLCSGGIVVLGGWRAGTAPRPPVDASEPCCPCDCPPSPGSPGGAGPSGSPSSSPLPTHTGAILPPIDLSSWTPQCTGGGDVPSAADPTDSESWVH